MTKSNTEIAAEVFGAEWPEQSDAVRGEWESFVDEVRGGNIAIRGDGRYAAVNSALGRDGDEPKTDFDGDASYIPAGEDAKPEFAKPAPAKKSVVDAKPKKASIIAKLKGKKHAE